MHSFVKIAQKHNFYSEHEVIKYTLALCTYNLYRAILALVEVDFWSSPSSKTRLAYTVTTISFPLPSEMLHPKQRVLVNII